MTRAPGSFRDPAGTVYFADGLPIRRVHTSYRRHWDALRESGLCARLQDAGLLVRHEEGPLGPQAFAEGVIAELRAEPIPLVTYPYEWCFGQLRDAALCTLEIQRRALDCGMTLKDASAYNIQFLRGSPVLIDTLSFELAEPGTPWIAYGQFCRHFLAPLAMIAHVHPACGTLSRVFLDGVPLDLASRALPARTRLSPGLLMHVHAHASAEAKAGTGAGRHATVSEAGLRGLIESLRGTIERLKWKPEGTVWADYYGQTNYSPEAFERKRQIVDGVFGELWPGSGEVWDLGANTGAFSEVVAKRAARVVAWDVDPAAVERHYVQLRADGVENVLPLVLDLTNPSPAIGWALGERESLLQRARPDAVMALALVHHLAIANNVPLPDVAALFASLAPRLLIEFVPKEDSQVQRLLATRRDIYSEYDEAGFERAFKPLFATVRKSPIEGTRRTLYAMEARKPR